MQIAAQIELASLAASLNWRSAEGLTRAVPWMLLIIVAAVVLLVLAFWLKRRFFEGPQKTPDEAVGGFSLSYLRKMHAAGEMSDDEYEKTRERIVSRAQKRIREDAEKAGKAAEVRPDQPRTKDVDLIREAE